MCRRRALPAGCERTNLPLPEVAEIDLMRHYTRLSQLNHSIDTGFYPLGSCTMKYNPKVNEVAARLPGFAALHPLQPEESAQGAMALMHNLQELLAEIAGFAAVTLQPAAGAHGELTGVLIMRKYLYERGETQRDVILVPDSAHGTNPATTSMSGLKVIEVPSDGRGNVDLEKLKALIVQHGPKLVGLMLTNPNTLGLFDENVVEVLRLVHEAGGLVYGDGANFNAILGIAKPGEIGFDVMHYNLHKTFSTPHGGGGPGSGAVGVKAFLAAYLPGPIVARNDEDEYVWHMPAKSIGRVKAFYGNFGVLVRAYTYIRMHGAEGLRQVSENAVLNANYLQARLRGRLPDPARRPDLHARVRGAGQAGGRARHPHDGHRQAADGLRDPPADGLLPAHRARGADDRADRDGEQGDAGRLRRHHDPDRRGGQDPARAAQDRAAQRAAQAAGRGEGGEGYGVVLCAGVRVIGDE